MTDRPSEKEAFADCEAITARNNSNLYLAAKTLPKWRYRYFLATYAAMRVIDDLVDEQFLLLPAEKRGRDRGDLLRTIEAWCDQSTGQAMDGPMPPTLCSALSLTAGKSDLGPWPWSELAKAMEHDARERDLQSWDDFVRYCHGATVAPAAIFVYLLGATREKSGQIVWPFEHEPRYYAEDLAIYCYIVHILRDLAKDADKSVRLLTIPMDLFARHGLQRGEVADALADDDARILGLAADLVSKARSYQKTGHVRLAEICDRLGRREAFALGGLIKIYDRLFDAFLSDYKLGRLIGDDLETAARTETFGE